MESYFYGIFSVFVHHNTKKKYRLKHDQFRECLTSFCATLRNPKAPNTGGKQTKKKCVEHLAEKKVKKNTESIDEENSNEASSCSENQDIGKQNRSEGSRKKYPMKKKHGEKENEVKDRHCGEEQEQERYEKEAREKQREKEKQVKKRTREREELEASKEQSEEDEQDEDQNTMEIERENQIRVQQEKAAREKETSEKNRKDSEEKQMKNFEAYMRKNLEAEFAEKLKKLEERSENNKKQAANQKRESTRVRRAVYACNSKSKKQKLQD